MILRNAGRVISLLFHSAFCPASGCYTECSPPITLHQDFMRKRTCAKVRIARAWLLLATLCQRYFYYTSPLPSTLKMSTQPRPKKAARTGRRHDPSHALHPRAPARPTSSGSPAHPLYKRHPAEMEEPEVIAWLTHLARERDGAASTQNQALAALLFLYRNTPHRDNPALFDPSQHDARRKARSPVYCANQRGKLQGRTVYPMRIPAHGTRAGEDSRIQVR